MPTNIKISIAIALLVVVGALTGWFSRSYLPDFFTNNSELLTPLISKLEDKELPLATYYLTRLAEQQFTANSPLTVLEVIKENSTYTSYLFTYTTQGKTMSGQLNVPSTPAPVGGYPAIVMLRGYVPLEIYETGVGTRNAAAVLAEQGFVTVAPDFLGFGQSDPDLEDTWEARFIKPMQMAELLATIKTTPILTLPNAATITTNPSKIGIWAHSNGGQIALATLEITGQPLPTTLWAPVTAPFPYSILFFSDELADEGQEQRAWIAMFEEDYDAREFSLTQHLDLLPNSSIQIHHGITDDAALIAWSDEFVQKIELENERRATFSAEYIATQSAQLQPRLEPIDIQLYRYPNTDHNLQPSWNTAVQRDVAFFKDQLRWKINLTT